MECVFECRHNIALVMYSAPEPCFVIENPLVISIILLIGQDMYILDFLEVIMIRWTCHPSALNYGVIAIRRKTYKNEYEPQKGVLN